MSAHYGARFADAWRGTDPASVKTVWAKELGRFTPDQLKHGIESLAQCKFPPTLPEFIALCKHAPSYAYARKLPPPRPTPEQREEGLRRFAEMKRALGWI